MNRLNKFAVVVLAAAVSALAQAPSYPPGQSPSPAPGQAQPAQPATPATSQAAQPAQAAAPAQPAAPEQKKEIKDPAEYNAYISAIGMPPAQKGPALEQFLQQYPNSVMKIDALQQIMGAYQQTGNMAKAMDAAGKVLQTDANNVPALFVMSVAQRAAANSGNPQAAAQARQYSEKGLLALPTFAKPEGMNDDAFQKFKHDTAGMFNANAGFGALQQKDFPAAQKYLLAAVESSPEDLANIYPLAVSYLEAKPPNPLGFWWGARAVSLSKTNAAANAQILKFVQNRYDVYHGGDDGWADLLAQTATATAPPPNFTVTQITPAVQAAKMAQTQDPKQMDFGTWAFIFQNGEPAVADRVWAAIKGVPLAFKAKIIEATPEKLMVAATQDAMDANTADTEVTMAAPVPAKVIPKVGSEIGIQASPASYDKTPYMLHLTGGKLVVSKSKPAPAHRRARKRPQRS